MQIQGLYCYEHHFMDSLELFKNNSFVVYQLPTSKRILLLKMCFTIL